MTTNQNQQYTDEQRRFFAQWDQDLNDICREVEEKEANMTVAERVRWEAEAVAFRAEVGLGGIVDRVRNFFGI